MQNIEKNFSNFFAKVYFEFSRLKRNSQLALTRDLAPRSLFI